MESVIDGLIEQITNNPPYNRLCHRISLTVDVSDALNTYGFKKVIDCSVLEVYSVCEHCKRKKGEQDKECTVGTLHNFKQVFIPIISCSGNTPEQALNNLLSNIASDE